MCCSDYRQCQRARLRDAPRRPALAPDREIAGQIRLVELAAGARGGRGGRAADHLGPVPLRLARSCRPGRRRTFPSGSPTSRWPRSRCSSRSAAGRRRLPAERDQLPVVGGRRRLFPARRAGASAAGSSASWCGRRSRRRGRSSSAGPKPTIVWAEPLIHIAPHDQPPPDGARGRAEPSGHVRGL